MVIESFTAGDISQISWIPREFNIADILTLVEFYSCLLYIACSMVDFWWLEQFSRSSIQSNLHWWRLYKRNLRATGTVLNSQSGLMQNSN